MVKKISGYLKSNNGDMYFQMLICLVAVIVIIGFSFNVITVMQKKVWLDDKLNDITRLVAVQGTVKSEEIEDLTKEIEGRMGGTVTFETDNWVDEDTGTVQLNDVVKVKYYNESFPAITILNLDIHIKVNVVKQGISEVYYKPSD